MTKPQLVLEYAYHSYTHVTPGGATPCRYYVFPDFEGNDVWTVELGHPGVPICLNLNPNGLRNRLDFLLMELMSEGKLIPERHYYGPVYIKPSASVRQTVRDYLCYDEDCIPL